MFYQHIDPVSQSADSVHLRKNNTSSFEHYLKTLLRYIHHTPADSCTAVSKFSERNSLIDLGTTLFYSHYEVKLESTPTLTTSLSDNTE